MNNNRLKNTNYNIADSEKPLASVLVGRIEGENIKLYVVGHEAITEGTMKLIEGFGEKLLLNPEMRANVHLHKKQRVPIFRVMVEKEDVICQTKYDITGNEVMVHSVATIRQQVLKDINVFVSNLMQGIQPNN